MQSPKKYGRIAKYVLTLLVATIASVQVAAFGMADFRVYQDMKSDIAEIERRMPRQQDSAGVDPGSVHYAGLGRIVINGEVVQERTPGAPRPAVQPDPGPVQAPEESQPPPQQPPSDTQDPKEDVPQKEEPAKTQSTNQAASSTPTPPKSSGSSGSSGAGQSGSGNQSSGGKTDASGNGQSSGGSQSSNSVASSSGNGNANNFNAHNNPEQQQTSARYVLNTSTKKFHIPSCNDVKKIAEKNYQESNDERDAIVANGYSSCKHCNP